MNDIKILESAELWEISYINKYTVTQCLIDFAFSLVLSCSPELSLLIRVENSFLFTTSDGVYELSPGEGPAKICPALGVFNQEVESLKISKRGELKLSFNNGMSMYVPSHPNFEAWTISGSKGLLIVCQPGGDVIIWHPE